MDTGEDKIRDRYKFISHRKSFNHCQILGQLPISSDQETLYGGRVHLRTEWLAAEESESCL